MDNQHRHIKGYRELTPTEIELMNRIKALGEEFAQIVDRVRQHNREQYEATQVYLPIDEEERLMKERGENDIPTGLERTKEAEAEFRRLAAAEPYRWHELARTQIQQGLMALTRAVAQPTTF